MKNPLIDAFEKGYQAGRLGVDRDLALERFEEGGDARFLLALAEVAYSLAIATNDLQYVDPDDRN